MTFETGVSGYVIGRASVDVPFPIDLKDNPHVACQFCPYLGATSRACRLNGQVVEFPEKYIGSHCPLNFD